MWILALISAFAQAPMAVTPNSSADVVFVQPEAGVVSKRFISDEKATFVTFDKGQALRVLYREAGWVRVRLGDKYGWVAEATVGPQAPDAPPAQPL